MNGGLKEERGLWVSWTRISQGVNQCKGPKAETGPGMLAKEQQSSVSEAVSNGERRRGEGRER